MKKRYKIALIFGIIVAVLLTLYLTLTNVVMASYYQARLPSGFNGTISRAWLFSVELRDVKVGDLKAERMILSFHPGSTVLREITIDGAEFSLFWDGDKLKVNQQTPEKIIATLSLFEKLPSVKIINSQCDLTWRNRRIALPRFALSFSSQGDRGFGGELRSLEQKRPFYLQFRRDFNAGTLTLVPEGRVELNELMQLAVDAGVVKPVSGLTLNGEVALSGKISFKAADRTIISSSLTGILNQSEIACGNFKIVQPTAAKIVLKARSGRLQVECSNLQLAEPAPLGLKHLTIELPSAGTTIAAVSGVVKIAPKHQQWLQSFGLNFISENTLEAQFSGSYNTANGVWGAWSESTSKQHEYTFKYRDIMIDLSLSKLKLSASGSGANISQLSLSTAAEKVLALSKNCRAHCNGMFFEIERNTGAATGILKLSDGIFNDFSLKNLKVKFTGELPQINADIVADNIAIPYKNTILKFDQPAVNANLELVQGQLKSIAFKGRAPKAVSGNLEFFNTETDASLENGILNGQLNFKDGSMKLNGAKLFSPAGKLYFKEHDLSLQTAELWYLSEYFNGKFDGVKLDATPFGSKMKVALNIRESNATLNGIAIKSGTATASSEISPDADPINWRPTMVQIDQITLNSKIIDAVVPKLIFDNNGFRFDGASLTLGIAALRDVSFSQPSNGAGSLRVAQFLLNNQEQGKLNATTTLAGGVLKINGKHLISTLDNSELNYSGTLNGAELKLDYQIPALRVKRNAAVGFLNPAWGDLQFSGRGMVSGQIVAGHEKYSCSTSLMLDDAALVSNDWAVNALRGNIEFIDLVTKTTLPHQKLNFGNMVIDGLELNDGTMIFHSVGANGVLLEHAAFNCLGGQLSLVAPLQFNPEADTTRLEFFAGNLDTGALLRRLGVPKATGNSRLNGRLPVNLSNRRIVPSNAVLNSCNGTLQLGGLEKFNAGASPELLENGQLPFIQAVLADFIYRELKITATGNTVKIDASGHPAAKVPFRWNEASKRFVKTNPTDGIGGELQITTEINNR